MVPAAAVDGLLEQPTPLLQAARYRYKMDLAEIAEA
jgi:hypothetical protein